MPLNPNKQTILVLFPLVFIAFLLYSVSLPPFSIFLYLSLSLSTSFFLFPSPTLLLFFLYLFLYLNPHSHLFLYRLPSIFSFFLPFFLSLYFSPPRSISFFPLTFSFFNSTSLLLSLPFYLHLFLSLPPPSLSLSSSYISLSIPSDLFLINRKWRNSAMNCEAYSSFEGVSSDHRIVTAKVRLSLRKNATRKATTKHYDWALLNNRDIQICVYFYMYLYFP